MSQRSSGAPNSFFSISRESAGMMRGAADGLMASIKAAEDAVGVATGTAHDEEDD